MFYSLDDFRRNVGDLDFQRNNKFSVIFSSSPTDKAGDVLERLGGMIFNNVPVDNNFFSSNNLIGNAINSTISTGVNRVVQRSGIKKIVIGATNNRLVQSILGEFYFGQEIIKFFSLNEGDRGLLVESVDLPSFNVGYEMNFMYNSPIPRIKNREYEPLNITFRTDADARNLNAMIEWNQSVKDPKTNLTAYPEHVDSTIQINLHDRNGIPHTTYVFEGCIPMVVKDNGYSHQAMNDISRFSVTFAYRSVFVGKVPFDKALEWLQTRTIQGAIDDLGIKDVSGKVIGGGIHPGRYSHTMGKTRPLY